MYKILMFAFFPIIMINARINIQKTQNQPPTHISAPKKHPYAPLVITVHGKEKHINNIHSCHQGSPQDQCECCLLETHSSSAGTKSFDEVVTTCTESNTLCTQESIQRLKSEKNLSANSSLDDLFKELYADAITRPLYVDDSLIDKNGRFTESTLPSFFAQAYREKKLFAQDLSNPTCIKVKNIADAKSGKKTVQLFLVTSTCSRGPATMYVVKEASNGLAEGRNLKKIQKLKTIKQCIAPHVAQGLPTLALPVAYFSYPAAHTVHYLALMPSAKGRTIKGIVNQYATDKTPQNKHKLERALYIFGKETANFHKLNMKKAHGKTIGVTVIHGDLHTANVFFDELNGHTIWIDLETMAHSIDKPTNPILDFDKALIVGKVKNMSQKEWYDIAVRQFVTGYAETYPKNQQAQVVREIKDLLYAHKTRKKGVYYDLKDIKDEYINPVLNELIHKMSK